MALPASIQRVVALYKYLGHLRPTLVFARLFRRFVVLLKILRSKWQTWYRKQRRSKPPSTDVESDDEASERLEEVNDNVNQIVIPHDIISYSLYSYGTGLHDGSRSSQILNASRSSHNLGIVSRSRNTSFSSHDDGPSDARSPTGGEYTFQTQPNSPRRTYSMSSPELARPRAADLHEAILTQQRPFILPQPRPDSSVESLELLSTSEISNPHIHLPASGPQIEQSTEIPSQIRILPDNPEIPSLDHHRIYPVVPENFQRYEKRRRIPRKATRVKMKPMVLNFSDRLDPPGWTHCTHPKGACYFYNAEKRIFTDVDLYDATFYKRIVLHIGIIETFISRNHIPVPEETDLVLDINLDANDTYVTDYYFANHRLRTVFFLDHFSSEYLPSWEGVKGINSGRHFQHAMEAQYWYHCETYPNALRLSDDLVCELRDTVMHSIGDMMASSYAISPYPLDELYKILILVDGLKGNIGKSFSGCTTLLSRLMFVFTRMKFLHFHGQPEARLNRDQSVYGTSTNQRRWFIKIISIFLFSAPDIHLNILQKVWVDGIIHNAVWETSLKKLYEEWREFILYATVLLNANVAFLGKESASVNRSPAQISSYCSVIISIGSIIIGLLLVRLNQTKNRDTAVAMQQFLRERAHPLLGLEILAIVFSLPYALLMWSMVSFVAAFLFSCLQDSGITARSVIGSLCGVIAVLIVWCIWTFWKRHPPSDAETPEALLSFEDDPEGIVSKNFTFEVVMPEPTEEPQWLNVQPSAIGLRLPLLFTWPAFLQPRRQSYNSNRTVVEEP